MSYGPNLTPFTRIAEMTEKRKPCCPVLARGVRYRWDEIRQQHQLLFPEGMLVLNETAAIIVQLCDGRSLENLSDELSQSFPNNPIQTDLLELLDRLASRGLIDDANTTS
jgi:pyrroloquinoline quinone biosynthesis protein D